MNIIIVILLIIGVILITIDITKRSYACGEKVIYRYIPRTLEQEEMNPALVSDIFKTMFSLPDPWVDILGSYDRNKNEQINNYFISQV